MKDENRLFVIPVAMENRDPDDIAREAAQRFCSLFDHLVAQQKQEKTERKDQDEKSCEHTENMEDRAN